MNSQIERSDLIALLEKRKADYLPKLIAKDNDEIRGKIKELQLLIEHFTTKQ